jgi:WD40 repeat protein
LGQEPPICYAVALVQIMICCLNPDCSNPLNPDDNSLCQTCRTPLVPLLRNRFRVIRVLSDEGGFGKTYLSEDIDKLKEHCVLKQLAPKFQGSWAQKKAMELFAQEALRLQELGEHHQIPTLLAYFEQDGCLYLVQQFIDGNNLLKELQLRKSYNDKDIQEILLDVLPILTLIHARGVIHRDIKPENIIRRKLDGRLVLIDFGSSKQLTARVKNRVGTSIGSHGYSPMEQIKDGKAYPGSDLFGLGATCFHLLTGVSPFHLWMEHGYAWVATWQEYLKSPISPELDRVIDKLLKKDIQQRYHSAEEVIKDLTNKKPQALPPAAKSADKPPATQQPSIPNVSFTLKNLFLASSAVLLVVLGERWYSHYQRLQGNFPSEMSQVNTNSDQAEAIMSQPSTISLGNFYLANTLKGHEHSILSIAISPDGKTVASNSDRIIKVWNLSTGESISTLVGHTNRVNAIAISPDGKTLVSGSEDNTIKIWNLLTGEEIHTLVGHSDSIHTLAISHDGKILIDGSDDNTINLWNIPTGKRIRTMSGHSFWVRSIAISSDGKTLASASFDKTIRLWNLVQGRQIRILARNSKTFTSIAFSPNGRILAGGSRDTTIKLWNLFGTEEISSLKGHESTVTTIAFSPDGKTLASGSRDKTIKLWNLQTGEEIRTLAGHESTVTTITFSPDGKTLVSGSEDNTIKIWKLSI